MSSGKYAVGDWSKGPLYARKTWSGGNTKDHKTWTPYMMRSWRFVQVPCSYLSATPPYPRVFVWGNCVPDTSSLWDGKDETTSLKALNQVSLAIRQHDFNAGVFLAESKESVGLIVGSVKACFKALRAVKRLDFPDLLRTMPGIISGTKTPIRRVERALRVRSVADLWLAVQYGWRPLIADLSEAVLAFNSSCLEPSSVQIRGRSKSPVRVVDLRTNGSSDAVNCRWTETVTYTVLLRQRLSTAASLGLDDPASIIWEKIPFSFVADWFIPIGDYLSERSFFSGLDLVYLRTSFRLVEIDCPTHLQNHWKGVLQGSYKGRRLYVDRTTGTSLPVPRPSFKTLGKALGKEHLQNAAALITGLVSDFRKHP